MRTFYPRKAILIDASEPHPKGTQYKVSLGDEDWGDGTFRSVVKVQMLYDGKVAGRMSPSYPAGMDDFDRVSAAAFELETGHSSENLHMIPTILSAAGLLTDLEEILGLVTNRRSFVSYKMVSVFDYMFYHLSDDVKVFCDYHPEEGYPLCDKIISILNELDTDDDTFPQEAIDCIEGIKHLHDEKRRR